LRTNIYIDGFNLYYGSVRKTPFKWLDIAALCRTLLPNRQINRIRYFTAHVTALPHDPQAPVRQDVYLRALKTIPNLTIHKGRFAARKRVLPQFPLAYLNPTKPPLVVQVLKTEEKRSDVNLATYLLVDCFDNDFDEAVIVSNDADLSLPIEIVKNKFGKIVGIINPHPKSKLSEALARVAPVYIWMINRKVLATCQFPTTLTDSKGVVTKPATW